MDTLWQDLRYGVRLLARSPGFTLVTVLTLAIGIGANTTIVSVANALLVRPLPVREPDTLVRAFSGRYSGTSLIDLLDYARASKTLQGIAPFREATLSLRTGSALEPLFGELVGGDDFDLVGVPAARGRTFLPYEGRAPRATLIARVDGDPIAAAPAIHDVLRQLDPDLPVFETRALREATSISLLPIRMAATFLGLLGLLVLVLAAIGLYGVLSFLVRLRTKEIGIRMALGADRSRVVRTVMRDAVHWMAWGVGVGLLLALLVTPLAASLLYGVRPHDTLTFADSTLHDGPHFDETPVGSGL
jgi:hypothetical protein